MAVSVSLQQTRTADIAGTYTVVSTVTVASGIPQQIFVYAYTTNLYDHVASPSDILNYPTVPTTGAAFYRTNTVSLTYTDVPTANAAAANVKQAVSDLVTAYGATVPTFVGSETTVYTG